MAKQIIWSPRAQADKKEILYYWHQRNKSYNYPKKLNQLFNEAITLVSLHPSIGRSTNIDSIKTKIVKEYLVIYEITETAIHILSIWDGRQNPSKLEMIIK